MTTLQEIIKEMEEDLKKQELLKNEATNNNDLNYHQGRIRSLQNHLPKLKSLLSEQGNERKDDGLFNIGDRVKVIAKKNLHGFEIGETITIEAVNFNANGTFINYTATNGKTTWKIRPDELHLLPSQSTTQRDEEKKNEPTEKKGVDVCLQCGWPIDHDGHYQNCKD
jgi:hypothetical protein